MLLFSNSGLHLPTQYTFILLFSLRYFPFNISDMFFWSLFIMVGSSAWFALVERKSSFTYETAPFDRLPEFLHACLCRTLHYVKYFKYIYEAKPVFCMAVFACVCTERGRSWDCMCKRGGECQRLTATLNWARLSGAAQID